VRARAGASENASRRGPCHENGQLVLCDCASVHAQGSIRATVKERFLNVVREIQPANGWKVVVVDAASTKLISRFRGGGRGGGTAGDQGRGGGGRDGRTE
jgi:hypothetical protein